MKTRSPQTIREFLIVGFTGVIAVTAFLSAVVGYWLIRSQLTSAETLIQNRVESSITLDRNELLNEIALDERASIQEHLDILRSSLNLDSIRLRFRSVSLLSENAISSRKSLMRLFVPSGMLKPLVIPLASDYGGLKADLEITYQDAAFRQVLRPVLVPLFGTLACFLLVELLALFAAFKLIDQSLVRPIQNLAGSFRTASSSKGSIALDPARLLLREFRDLSNALSHYHEVRESSLTVELARQVAHDIRSPLAALEVAAGDVSQLPEDKRILVRSAVARIRDIANSLLDKKNLIAGGSEADSNADVISTSAQGAAPPQLLSSLIESLVSEKRLQFRSRSLIEIDALLDSSSYGVFARVQAVEFKRLLSNLINNSVEAFGEGPGTVRVHLSSHGGRALVIIQDDGKGITPEILAKLGHRGETHGKAGGFGLGLHHARTSAELWGGDLQIASEVGKGTVVTVSIPQAPTPDSFVSELALIPELTLVILDDDESIHQVWQGRLDALQAREHGIEIVHVSKPREIRDWVKGNEHKAREALYLLDYELLGCTETGLSLAEELGVGEQSILVTSRFEEPDILEGCRKLKTRMIPKGLARLVPIRIVTLGTTSARERWDAVLIDDDPLVRMTWQVAADLAQKRLKLFASAEEFFPEAEALDRGTPIYIDATLGNGVRGEEESRRIHAMGFKEIYLATGQKANEFSAYVHLRGVVGKNPPWTS